MALIKIKQVKSGIDRSYRQKRTLVALGLRKMHATVEVEATPQILGMVRKVFHLVEVADAAGVPISEMNNATLRELGGMVTAESGATASAE